MMKNVYLIAAAAAAVLVAGCAKNEVIQNQGPGDAVSFGVYVPKTVTKAGAAGTMTLNTEGTTKLTATGFGVFATYSDGGSYASTTGPNFMYNQEVTWTPATPPAVGGTWGYTPTKYWPNETIHDSNDAYGPAAADKLSFFAYAPYVDDPNSADDWGITDLTDNNSYTDPKVTYAVATDPSKAVDLIWAVAPAGGFNYTDVHGTPVSVTAGMPLINLTKPNITTTIPFHFRHATARLGFKIIGAIDQIEAGGTLASQTKITVEEICVVDLPVNTSGVLNLNNTEAGANTPKWESLSGESTTLLINEGKLNTTIKDASYPGDTFDEIEGVLPNIAKNVFVNDNTFFTLLPKDGPITARIKITYYVTTKDGNLASGYSRVQNIIYKDINFASGFQAGKAYNIKIILGLTSVKLEADVQDWDVVTPDTEVDLPINHNNSFDLASTASVTLDGNNDGTTAAVWTTAEGEVTIDGTIKKAGVDFANDGPVISLTGDKKISFDNAVAGVYVIPLKAAGDATHNPVTKTITVTVTAGS